ncbi:hypothetical protein OB955_02170 [Halobacteria archaeon AArc-m2/3/4]|uniref:Uncharacterized protein n=1 Tax=Natronoglomus mannanivorans TaxID=2979990 RepID=A0AAP2YWS8_9EURY|nr:hypothetical protein [Halobacteria archaeon AArc-xg1-1]MCU4971547.1 hypothetical protein [Halobacteria archaeon AArc-m2/3/4]
MGTELGGGVPKSATFAHALGTLKQQGSNILLVGSASEAHGATCLRLLGETNDHDQSRYRLFVVTEQPCCSHEHGHGHGKTRADGDRPGDDPNEHENEDEHTTTRIITRSADGPERTGELSPNESVVGTELLSPLGSEIIETVNEFDDVSGGLEPSELRVCVDSLVPLLTEHNSENVFRLLHVLTLRIRQANGMGHFHLPIDADHDAVNLLEPLFDAVVEVRSRDGASEQRWHLRDQQTSSDWIQL